MIDYQWIKTAHISLAVISVAGFGWRGMAALWRGAALAGRFWRTAPHIVDTVLLGSGAWLAWRSSQYPFANSTWLSIKMMALLAYIAFGMLALNYARGPVLRIISFAAALFCAWVMFHTAIYRSPLVLTTF